MKEFRKVMQFTYNKQKYNMYLDNNNKHFFLKVDDNNNLAYVTLEELVLLTKQFTNYPKVMNIINDSKKNKVKFIPKVIHKGMAFVLTASLLMGGVSAYNEIIPNDLIGESNVTQQVDKNDVKLYISTEENVDELKVDTYFESNTLKKLDIYDMDYLDKAFKQENITIDDLYNAIKNNDNISNDFKDLFYEYCDALVEKYPNVELRVLYENLKDIKVLEYSKQEMKNLTKSDNSYGCYDSTKNTIYVLENYKYEKGTWAYQVIFHELSHCLRTGNYNINNKSVRVTNQGLYFNSTITEEALNSVFAVSLFDYEEDMIGYQLQSNYQNIMLECMDNYNLSDYVNHSLSYYAKKLDEQNNDDNYATVILNLIENQYIDYHNDDITVEQSEYYPIYDYISNMYFNKYVTPNMSYEEAQEVANTLVNKVLLNVPDKYNIDTNRFYQNLDIYCNSIGISINLRTR